MSDVIIKPIRDLLLYNKKFSGLLGDSKQQQQYDLILKQYLPRALQPFCHLNRYGNGQLSINASTGSAATQLRFQQHRLMAQLKNHQQFRALQTITIKVSAQKPKLDRAYRRPVKTISQRNRTLLRETANNLADHDLASAMRNLADTIENYGKD